MTEKRIREIFAHGRISYPQFEGDTLSVKTINAFYHTLRDAAAAYSEEMGPARIYTADYTLKWEENMLLVDYTLQLRHRGRIVARKTLSHQWVNGYLIPPGKKRKQKRKIRLKRPGKKDII